MCASMERIAWRVHPVVERPRAGILVLGMVLLLSVLAGIWMGAGYWSLFAFVVLFLSLEAFFLPSHFELGEEGVAVRKSFSRVTRPWGHFRKVIFDRRGVTLSPFRRRHWLDSYRAMRLQFADAKRAGDVPAPEDVRRFILAHINVEEVRLEGLPLDEQPSAMRAEPSCCGKSEAGNRGIERQ